MSNKTSGVPNKTVEKISRRKRVITMLEAQLKLGTKNVFVQRIDNGTREISIVPLTEKDVIRIKKELETLKASI